MLVESDTGDVVAMGRPLTSMHNSRQKLISIVLARDQSNPLNQCAV